MEEEREKSLICAVLSTSSKWVLFNLFTTKVGVCMQFSAWIEILMCVLQFTIWCFKGYFLNLSLAE